MYTLYVYIGDEHPLVTAQVVADLPAQTSRNETLDWVYTACVWHIAGRQMARSYIERLLLPQVLRVHIGGLCGVQHVTVHCENDKQSKGYGGWYATTKGSKQSRC